MNTNHLSNQEQEEYVLNERTPQIVRHLAECPDCQASVARLQQTIGMFRSTAIEYSEQCLHSRPQQRLSLARSHAPAVPLRWALAALVPVLLVLLALLPLRVSTPKAVHPAAPITDDALLDQVDEQLSVAVPSSMESLTHLVSTGSGNRGASGLVTPEGRSKAVVPSN